VVSEIVTVCADVNVPGVGENVGVAAGGRLSVYTPVAVALVAKFVAVAIALIVSVLFTAIGAVYRVELVVGVLPSVVKKTLAPAVVSASATVCTVVYVPGAGENVGVSTGGWLIVYAPVPTALVVKPVAVAIALMVSAALTLMGAVKCVEDIVGVLPSSV
jgi:hypothetical protein